MVNNRFTIVVELKENAEDMMTADDISWLSYVIPQIPEFKDWYELISVTEDIL